MRHRMVVMGVQDLGGTSGTGSSCTDSSHISCKKEGDGDSRLEVASDENTNAKH